MVGDPAKEMQLGVGTEEGVCPTLSRVCETLLFWYKSWGYITFILESAYQVYISRFLFVRCYFCV